MGGFCDGGSVECRRGGIGFSSSWIGGISGQGEVWSSFKKLNEKIEAVKVKIKWQRKRANERSRWEIATEAL